MTEEKRTRVRKKPVQLAAENLPLLTVDELHKACRLLCTHHPRQAVALAAMLEEAMNETRPAREATTRPQATQRPG